MEASDQQSLNNLIYGIRGDGLAPTYFEVNNITGVIRTTKLFTDDNNKTPSYTVRVFAYRQNNPLEYAEALVHVTVIRNPSAPSFLHGDLTFRIPESQQLSVAFGKVNATDPDVGTNGEITYSISAIDPTYASSYFFVNPYTGTLILIGNLMEDPSTPQYLLTISAKDNAGIVSKTATATVTVNVNRNLQDPRWLNLPVNLQTTISITENDPLGQAVFTLSAEDLDIWSPDNQVEFRLTGNTQAQNYFRIDSVGYNGVISLIRSPVQDRTINQFTLTVSLTDKGVPPRSAATATVFVNVLRNDQPPVYFNSTYYVELREDVAISTSVAQVSATDSDTNNNFNQITYRIIGDDTAPNFFTIVSSGSMAGWIITSRNLATDSTDTFRIRLEATDNGAFPRKATALVFVKVLHNFNSPLWPLNQLFGSVTIPENQNLDSVIYTLPLATDRDSTSPNNITNYRLIGSTPSQGQNYYQVNAATGEVTIKKDLTRDPGVTPYRLTFQAYDLGTPSLTGTQTLTLTVNVYRNTPPVFSPSIYNTMVDETRNVNSNILTLSATDSDAVSIPGGLFSQLTYRIASPASALQYFSVLVDNGQVVLRIVSLLTNAPLDKYLLIVQVTDDGGLSNYAEVTVDIRRNLNAPQFTQASYVVNITEDRAVGSGIEVTVLATDSDLRAPYNTVMYAFVVDDDLFDIDRNTGRITVQSSLLGRTQNSYQYQIYAYDGGNPSQKSNNIPVTINIIRNQFPPEILNLPRQINITNSFVENNLVFTVQYRDNDTQAPFNTISTEIVGVVPTSDLFKINPVVANQASILMNRDANTGTQENYYIWIRARDGGSPSKTTEALLKVFVTRNCNKSVSCVIETDWNLTVECPEDRYSIVDIVITNAGNISNGSPVNITCMLRVINNVTPTITWKYDGTVMKPVNGSRISISDITVDPETPQRRSQTMSFRPIQSSDSGTYECVVTNNNLPPSVKNMTVIVKSQPEVFIKPLTQSVDAGSTVTITCEVKDDVQITQMLWYRNGTNINSTNKLSEETFLNGTTTNIHVLTHRNIRHTTRYECRGENHAGQGNMQQAIIYVVLPGSQLGETCKTENDTRGTEWSRTLQDTYDKKPCPTEMSGEAVRYCSHGGVWRDPSYDNCIKNTLLDLQKLIDKIKNGQAPNIVPDSLVNLVGLTNPNMVELHKAEVEVVSSILNDVIQISNNTNITNNDVENFLEIASNLIDVRNSPAWQALIIEGKEGATTVLPKVEDYNRIKAKSINSADEPVKRFTRKNLFVEIGYNPVSDIQFPNTTANGSAFINGSSSGFVLSRDVFNNGNYTSYSCAYFNNVSGIIQRFKTNTGADLEINSAVLSLQLDPLPPPLLSPPLILTFKHFSANYSKPVCSYWMFIAPGNGAWSSNGCKVVSTSDYTTVCECNHLTNFAILMSPGKTPDKDQVPLSIISTIGCAISIFCLSVTMITHFIVWRYVKSDRTSLLMNLCLALIISYIIFLAGVDRTENKGVCIAVAALLHYFYLAVFFLILTYGIELAVSVIYVFVTRSRIQWLLPLAWILPAVVVAISLGVTKLEGYGNEKFCWLSIKDGLIWAFVGPAALVTLINFIIIIVVFKHMFSTSTMMTKSDKDKAKTAVRSLCVLLPVTGVTWVFGILSVNEDLVVFQYLFAIINSLQGLFISLFHCFFNHNLRQAIKQINAKRKRSLVTYSTTPKISSNSSEQIKDREERHEMIREVPVNQDQIITRF